MGYRNGIAYQVLLDDNKCCNRPQDAKMVNRFEIIKAPVGDKIWTKFEYSHDRVVIHYDENDSERSKYVFNENSEEFKEKDRKRKLREVT